MKESLRKKTNTAEVKSKELAGHYEEMQKSIFTNWINFHLTPHGIIVQDLYEELKDGVILFKLLGILTAKNLPALQHAKIISKRLDNLNICLRLLKSQKVQFFNVDANDIEQGHHKVILALIYAIWVHFEAKDIKSSALFKLSEISQPANLTFENDPQEGRYDINPKATKSFSYDIDPQEEMIQDDIKRTMSYLYKVQSSSGLSNVRKSLDKFEAISIQSKYQARKKAKNPSIRTQILESCNVITKKYGLVVKDILNSCKDGRVFMALIHYCDPSLVNFDSVSPAKGQDNIKKAIQISKEKLRVVASFEPEEFLNETSIDETGPISFISSLMLTINSKRSASIYKKRNSIKSVQSLTNIDDEQKLFDDIENIMRQRVDKNETPISTRDQIVSDSVSKIPRYFEIVYSSVPNICNLPLKLFNEPINKKKQRPKVYVLANRPQYKLNMQELNQEAYFEKKSLNNYVTEEHKIYNKSVRWLTNGTPYSQTQIIRKNSIQVENSIKDSNDSSNGISQARRVGIGIDMKNADKTKWRKRPLLSENSLNQENEDQIAKNKEYLAKPIIIEETPEEIISIKKIPNKKTNNEIIIEIETPNEKIISEQTTSDQITNIRKSTIYRKPTSDGIVLDEMIPTEMIPTEMIPTEIIPIEMIKSQDLTVDQNLVAEPVIDTPPIAHIIAKRSFSKKVSNQFSILDNIELTSEESDNKKLIYIVNALYENDKLKKEYQQWLKAKINSVIKLKNSFTELNIEKETHLLENEIKILSESLIELVKRRNEDYRSVEYYEQNIFVRFEHLGQKIKFKITKEDLFKKWKELFEIIKAHQFNISAQLEQKFITEQVEYSISSKIDLWETILDQFKDCFETSIDLAALRLLSEKYEEFVSECTIPLENDTIVIHGKEETRTKLQKLNILYEEICKNCKSIGKGFFFHAKDSALYNNRSKLLLRKGSQIYEAMQNLILQKSSPLIQGNEFLLNLIEEEFQDYQNKVMKYKDNLAPDVMKLYDQLVVAIKTAKEEIIYSNKFLQWKQEAKEICRKVKRLEQIFKLDKSNAFEFFYNISSKIKLFKPEKLTKKFDKIKSKAKQIKESAAEFIESANIDKDSLLKKESKLDNAMIKFNTISGLIKNSYENFNAFEKLCFDYNELMINMSNYMLGSYERSVKMDKYLPEDYILAIASSEEIGNKYQASFKLLETNIKLFSLNFKSFCDDYEIEKTELDAKILEIESNLNEKYLQFRRLFVHEDNKLTVASKLYSFNQKANKLALKLIEDNVILTSVVDFVKSDSANILNNEAFEPINNNILNIKTKVKVEYMPELASIGSLLMSEDHSFTKLKEFTHPKITSISEMISSIKLSIEGSVALLNQFKLFTDVIASCENMKLAKEIFSHRYWSSSYYYRNVLRKKLISDFQDVLKKGKYIPESEYYTNESISENYIRAIYDLNYELQEVINLKCLTKINNSVDFKLLYKKNFLWWNVLLFKANLFFDFDLTMHDADYKFNFFTELNDELVNYGNMCEYYISIRKKNSIKFDIKDDKELLENIVLLEKLDKSIENEVNKCATYLKKASKAKKFNLVNKNIKILNNFTTNALKYINSEIAKSNNQLSEDSFLQLVDVEMLLQKHNTTYNESLSALKHPKKTETNTSITTLKNVEALILKLNEAKQRAKQKFVLESLLKQINQTETYVKNRIVSCSYENFYCIYLKKCLAHSITSTQMKRKGNSIVDLLSNIKTYIERKDMGFETVSTRYSQLCVSLNEVKKIVEEENKCTSFNYVKDDIPLYASLQKYEITFAEMFVKIFLKKSTQSLSDYITTEDKSQFIALIKHSKKILDNITKLENSSEMIELQEKMNQTIQLYDDHEHHCKGDYLFNKTKGMLDYIEKWLTAHLTDIKSLLSLEINSTNISQTTKKIKILMEIFETKNSKLVSDTLSNCKKLDEGFWKNQNSDKLKMLTTGMEKIDTFTSQIKNCCTEVETKMKFEKNKYMIEAELEIWEVAILALHDSQSMKITEDSFADIIKRIGEYNYKIDFNDCFLNSTLKAVTEKCNESIENNKANLSSLKVCVQDIGKNSSEIQLSLSKGKEKLNERYNFVQVQKELNSLRSSTDTSYLNCLKIGEYMHIINCYLSDNNSFKEDYASLKESFELQYAIPLSFSKQSKNTGKNLPNEWIFSTNILINHITEVINDMNGLSKFSNQPFSILQKVEYDFVLMNFLHLNSWIQGTQSKFDEIIKDSYSLENAIKSDNSKNLKATNDFLAKKLDEMNANIISIGTVININKMTCTFLSRVNKINCHSAYLCQNIRRKMPPENISECLMDLSSRGYRVSTIKKLHLALSKLKAESQKLDTPQNSILKEVKSNLNTCESLIESAYSDFNVLFETLRIEWNAFAVTDDISKISADISEIIKLGKTLVAKPLKTGEGPSTNIVFQYMIEFLNNQYITQKTAIIEDAKAVSDLIGGKIDPLRRKTDLDSEATNEKIIYDKFSFIVPQKCASFKKDSNKEYPLLLSGYFLMKKINKSKKEIVENSGWQLYVFGMYKKSICYFLPTNETRITLNSSGVFKSQITNIRLAPSQHNEIFLIIEFKREGEYMLWFSDTNEHNNFNTSLDTTKLRIHK